MTLVRWSDPFREFAQLQDRINRVFSDSYGRGDDGLLTSGTWVPPVDIYQNGEHEVVLKAELPDMTREDIDITVDNGTLTIRGEKKFSNDVKEESFRRIERRLILRHAEPHLPQRGPRPHRHKGRCLALDPDGLFDEWKCRGNGVPANLLPRLQVQLERARIRDRPIGEPPVLVRRQPHAQRLHNVPRHPLLHLEHVVHRAAVLL